MLTCAQTLSPWAEVKTSLWTHGFARIGQLLSAEECQSLRQSYADPKLFRSRVDMARFRFGRGEYQYFAAPLPGVVARLREQLYPPLAEIAHEWMVALKHNQAFPASLSDFLSICRQHGQDKPTPLLLRYRAGDYNCLHQDLYGKVAFPFQVIICLSRVGEDFTGGELLLVEQRPRAQSVGRALTLAQGEGVVITTRDRPVKGSRGYHRTAFRHGVSPVLSGERFTLGVIFHDAA
jgi:uncharacterized protein